MPDLPLGQPPAPSAIAVGSHGPGLCRYVLPGLWQLHLYPYACTAEIAGQQLDIRPGTAGLTPPGAIMRYRLSSQRAHSYAHFTAAGDTVAMPLLVDCGRDFATIEARLRDAATWLPRQPERAAARLWDVLWEVAGRAPRSSGDALVEQARDLIELRLATRLRVATIARQLNISHSQLDRRFRAALGSTVVGFVRARRAHLAHHLLRSSDLDAAAIARQVGAGDAQALNKLLRRELGAGPRALRSG
jgi:AraC family transcriptional regulator